MSKMGVFSFVNHTNGKVYVGSSKNIYKRINEYEKQLNYEDRYKRGFHNRELQRDWNKGHKINVKIIKDNCESEDEIRIVRNRELIRNKGHLYNVPNVEVTFDGGNPNTESIQKYDNNDTNHKVYQNSLANTIPTDKRNRNIVKKRKINYSNKKELGLFEQIELAKYLNNFIISDDLRKEIIGKIKKSEITSKYEIRDFIENKLGKKISVLEEEKRRIVEASKEKRRIKERKEREKLFHFLMEKYGLPTYLKEEIGKDIDNGTIFNRYELLERINDPYRFYKKQLNSYEKNELILYSTNFKISDDLKNKTIENIENGNITNKHELRTFIKENK